MCTIVCDPEFDVVYIGQLSDNIDNSIRVMAYHYANLFTKNTSCFPYFN